MDELYPPCLAAFASLSSPITETPNNDESAAIWHIQCPPPISTCTCTHRLVVSNAASPNPNPNPNLCDGTGSSSYPSACGREPMAIFTILYRVFYLTV
jgi:hypothetical protein